MAGVNTGSAPYEFRMLFTTGEEHVSTCWDRKKGVTSSYRGTNSVRMIAGTSSWAV